MKKNKVCRGHFCQGTERPLSDFYKHRSGVRKGKPFSRCKRCWRYQVTHPIRNPLHIERVPVKLYADVVEELRRRIGLQEAARRMGSHPEHLYPKRIAEKKTVTRRRYQSALTVLEESRAADEDGFDSRQVRMNNLRHQQRKGIPMQERQRDYWLSRFEEECENRKHILVTGPMGWPMLVSQRFTMDEIGKWNKRGFCAPLDLVSHEYWWIEIEGFGRVPRYGEEMTPDF